MTNEEALEILADIINRGRSFCAMTKLSEPIVAATAEQWDDFLRANKVDRERYWDCLQDFMLKDRVTKFTVYDLRDSWLRMKAKAKSSDAITELDAKCGGCFGSGWTTKELVVGEDGRRRWVDLTMGNNSSAAKPCTCPQGRKFDKSHKLAASENRKVWEQNGCLSPGAKAAAELDRATYNSD